MCELRSDFVIFVQVPALRLALAGGRIPVDTVRGVSSMLFVLGGGDCFMVYIVIWRQFKFIYRRAVMVI